MDGVLSYIAHVIKTGERIQDRFKRNTFYEQMQKDKQLARRLPPNLFETARLWLDDLIWDLDVDSGEPRSHFQPGFGVDDEEYV